MTRTTNNLLALLGVTTLMSVIGLLAFYAEMAQ